MAGPAPVEQTLRHSALVLLLLSVSGSLGQKDCTGVDCPDLSNCIEERLEAGACCTTCVQIGCTCEGYQYYDCVHAGFKNGHVPEGQSYFVDFGSTECSCPEGGGRIGCHFMPCPDVPANCIEVSEPADGCVTCERIGCVHDNQKYEAGHSFHLVACEACHCPSDGGQLMCYPVPGCDPSNPGDPHKPMLATIQEGHPTYPPIHPYLTQDKLRETERDAKPPFNTQPIGLPPYNRPPYPFNGPKLPPSNSPHLPPFPIDAPIPSDHLPLFKPDHMTEDGDYDYPTTDTSEPPVNDLAYPTPSSSVISVSYPGTGATQPRHDRGNSKSYDKPYDWADNGYGNKEYDSRDRQELREIYGVHEPTTDTMVTDRVGLRDRLGQTDRSQHIGRVKLTDKLKKTDRLMTFGLYKATTDGFGETGSPVTDSPVTGEQTTSSQLEDTTVETTSRSTSSSHQDTTSNWNRLSESQIYPHSQGASAGDALEIWDRGMEEEQEEEEERVDSLENTTGPGWRDVAYDGELDKQRRTGEEEEREKSTPSNHVKDAGVSHQDNTTVEHSTTSPRRNRDHIIHRKPHQHTLTQKPTPHNTTPREYEVVTDRTTSPRLPDHHTLTRKPDHYTTPKEYEVHTDRPIYPRLPDHHTVKTPRELDVNTDRTTIPRQAEHHSLNRQPDHHTLTRKPDPYAVRTTTPRELNHHTTHRQPDHYTLTRHPDPHHPAPKDPEQQHTPPRVRFSPTSQPSLRVSADLGHHGSEPLRKQSQTLFNLQNNDAEEEEKEEEERGYVPVFLPKTQEAGPGPSSLHVVESCCEVGQRWASENQHCNNMPLLKDDKHSVCSISQQQCCQNVLKETRCLAGITAAKGGDRCEVNQESQCAADSYQVCCSCCVLGLALHSEGRGCDAHQYLGNPCGHVLLTCCEEEGLSPNPNQTQSRKERPRPTTLSEKDVNECVTSMHSCQASERCVNTVGSFVCETTVTCPAGFQLRNQVCEDIDECLVRSHNCGQRFECENTEGSFLCNPKQRCLTGFTQDSHGNCIDINECSSLSDPCSAGFHCINTVGSYTCQRKVIMCSQGYHSSPDGTRCIDVDECQTGNHGCGEGQICHNLPGSYRCDCQTGYLYDALRQVCSDVNECWSYPGRLCAQTCENSPGSYQCSCTAGFSLAFDGKNCEDLNECDSSPCGQECANIYGSYQCYCRQGFYLKEDGHTCEDIDECSQSVGNLCVFQCVNIPGSYQCACPPNGYTMSTTGHTCRDIDECTTGVHNCSTEQTCSNVQGGYRCLTFSCPTYYRKVSDTRCERSGCPANSVDCQTSPLRITYYQLSFQINIVIPTQIFRIGPSPAYRGDNIAISITHGNEENYFSTRKLNSFTGAVYLQRQVRQPRDFLIDVEMKLLRQGAFTTFLARIYVFITSNTV
ncbi:fibulin-2-like isoform X2 [Oncorhynchus keta]|uniref:fibulin-2-like isoform X1 n=1 Tax=Oncorhynchus keta TaxID=8018 RepID=UPI00227B7765|nr:fibulin-2-like isoform X1 [Oncorhynchus keta]XP_052330498.1 fibulin-2-like isoform X2 [Oncorhynchus keta]